MKTKRIPFDLAKAKSGAKVVTRCGYPVRMTDFYVKNKDGYVLIGAIDVKGNEIPYSFMETGCRSETETSDYDLFIEEEEMETDDYNPYKEVVKSISDMVERYSDADSDLQDFYDSVKVKCREAVEYDKRWCKKQDEQKTSDSLEIKSDKWYTCIESWCSIDMKIGDWFEEDYYYLGSDILKYKGLLKEDEDYKDFFRPWDINDAKDGDVLCYETKDELRIFIYKNGYVYFHCHYYNRHLTTVDSYFVIQKHLLCYIHPATKEQRDLLFQKMKEAGYEWNADKKELKKIGEEVKTRRMTNQELADWLRKCPEEFREFTFKDGTGWVYSYLDYLESEADEPAKNKLIRRNHGEWQEPLVEIEEDQTMLITLDKFGNELIVGDKVLCPEFIPSGHGCQIFRGKIDRIVHQNKDVYQIYVSTAKGSWMFFNNEIVKCEDK